MSPTQTPIFPLIYFSDISWLSYILMKMSGDRKNWQRMAAHMSMLHTPNTRMVVKLFENLLLLQLMVCNIEPCNTVISGFGLAGKIKGPRIENRGNLYFNLFSFFGLYLSFRLCSQYQRKTGSHDKRRTEEDPGKI